MKRGPGTDNLHAGCAPAGDDCRAAPPGRSSRGFTLIELLIVAAVLAVVIGSIAACLAAGIRAWDAARNFGRTEAETAFGLSVLRRDLHNAVDFHAVSFRGEPDEVNFAALVRPPGGGPARIAAVGYRLDRGRQALVRSEEVFRGEEGEREEVVLSGVPELDFRYRAAGDDSPGWETSATSLPARVAVTLRLETGGAPREWLSEITIPVARQ